MSAKTILFCGGRKYANARYVGRLLDRQVDAYRPPERREP